MGKPRAPGCSCRFMQKRRDFEGRGGRKAYSVWHICALCSGCDLTLTFSTAFGHRASQCIAPVLIHSIPFVHSRRNRTLLLPVPDVLRNIQIGRRRPWADGTPRSHKRMDVPHKDPICRSGREFPTWPTKYECPALWEGPKPGRIASWGRFTERAGKEVCGQTRPRGLHSHQRDADGEDLTSIA